MSANDAWRPVRLVLAWFYLLVTLAWTVSVADMARVEREQFREDWQDAETVVNVVTASSALVGVAPIEAGALHEVACIDDVLPHDVYVDSAYITGRSPRLDTLRGEFLFAHRVGTESERP